MNFPVRVVPRSGRHLVCKVCVCVCEGSYQPNMSRYHALTGVRRLTSLSECCKPTEGHD